MIKHMRKVGNSNAIVLDKAIMELIGLEENGPVQLTVTHGSLIVTPARPRTMDKKRFERCLDHVFTKHRELLRKLAR